MLEYLTLGEFTVALLMSLAALMAFIWASASGAFAGIEAAKHQVLRVEGIPTTEDELAPDDRRDGDQRRAAVFTGRPGRNGGAG